MIKIIIYLFIVTQIYCLAEDDNKSYKEDEVDITTIKSHIVKDSPEVDLKSVPEYDSQEVPKDLPKDIPKDDIIPKPDINEKEQIPKTPNEKLPDNYDTDTKSEKPVYNNPGYDQKGQEVDEKITKKVEKPLYSKPDFDLGKDYKKVDIKPNEKEVPIGSYDPNTFDGSDKEKNGYDKKPDLGIGGEGGYGSEEEKGYRPPGLKPNREKEVQIANEIWDNLLKLIKSDYRSDFEQIKLDDFQPFNHGRWGSVSLHSGVVTGLTNIERTGNVVVIDEYDNKKVIIGDIAVKDVYADYKMNAKLFHRISFKDRDLKLQLKKAVLTVKLEVDKNQKKLIVKELNLKTFEEFGLKSGRLFWPFNKLTNAIIKNQEQVIKDLIKKEFNKYMGKVVHNIQFDEVFDKLF